MPPGPDRPIVGYHTEHPYGYQAPPAPTQEDLRLGLAFLAGAQLPTLQAAGQDRVDKEILRQYGVALSIEVSEFLNETPWKEWKTYEGGADAEAIVKEFVDVLHFVGTWVALMRHWGIHPSQIAQAFVEKNQENRRRFAGQVEGYGWQAAQEGGLDDDLTPGQRMRLAPMMEAE